jgi:hypothetical protein
MNFLGGGGTSNPSTIILAVPNMANELITKGISLDIISITYIGNPTSFPFFISLFSFYTSNITQIHLIVDILTSENALIPSDHIKLCNRYTADSILELIFWYSLYFLEEFISLKVWYESSMVWFPLGKFGILF